MLQQLARRARGDYLTVYVDVLPDPGPQGGLVCLFQRADGRMQHLREADMAHYKRLHHMLQNRAFANHPLVAGFSPACHIEATREWGAFAQAAEALERTRENNPYAGLAAQDVANKLFERLRTNKIPAPAGKPPRPV